MRVSWFINSKSIKDGDAAVRGRTYLTDPFLTWSVSSRPGWGDGS